MEPDSQKKLTCVERLALFVERKLNLGRAVWAVVYFLTSLVLLPAVLILSAGRNANDVKKEEPHATLLTQ